MNLDSDALPDTSAIKSRKDFILFLEQLHANYLKSGTGWENRNLNDFLEALSAYAADVDGFYNNMAIVVDADTASWRLFADILCGAIMYE